MYLQFKKSMNSQFLKENMPKNTDLQEKKDTTTKEIKDKEDIDYIDFRIINT